MITALVALIITQLAGITGLKFWTRRAQRKAELRRWAPFRQNPLVDPLLRKYAGELTDPTKRWAAKRIKSTARNFVNSEAFSIAVDGMMNTDSSIWDLAKKLGFFNRPTKLGGLQPEETSVCTIQ